MSENLSVPADSGDALARLREIPGCGRKRPGARNALDATHTWAVLWVGMCDACASLLVTAIAAPVERETIERCAKTAGPHNQTLPTGADVGRHNAAVDIRALPPRYGGNPNEKGNAI